MKRIVAVAALLVAVTMPVENVTAGEEGETAGHYRSTKFHWVQDYYGWGPACHYGQPVRVVYDAKNAWTYALKDGHVRASLIQKGRATVYIEDEDGKFTEALDSQPFEVTERFSDRRADVVIRHDREYIWYQVSHNWVSPKLEFYEYDWKIQGVYNLRCRKSGADWSFSWASGGCEGGERDGLPPLLPYPHTSLRKETGKSEVK